ncbi:MAG: DUF1302 domain-containing protein [Pseudomonadota bacterium]
MLRISFVLISLVSASPARAEIEVISKRLTVRYQGGATIDDGALDLSRATAVPEVRLGFGQNWRADLAVRLEVADDGVGLGGVASYSDAARPLIRSETIRLEIDAATLTYSGDAARLTLGKQSVPWGVLDGLRVADRFDAVRLRDFLLTDVRPDRLSRWGARLETKVASISVDLAAAFDPTVNQFAAPGDTFFPTASRFRGGLPLTASAPILSSERDRYAADGTYGARLSRRFGAARLAVLAFSGPETDPILRAGSTEGGGFAVETVYPYRRVFAATADFAAGSTVWRVEAASIPRQPVNVAGRSPLDDDRRPRNVAGVGVDWNAPGDVFVNAQIAVDHVDAGDTDLARPETDVIGTLQLRRSFNQELGSVTIEYIGALNDGDGLVRPRLRYRLTDQVEASIGADLLFGPQDGQFGQFRSESRGWLRLALDL